MVARKIIPVLAVVFILVVLAVPAGAYGFVPDGTDEPLTGYAPLSIDYISDGYGQYTWPFNSSIYGTHNAPFTFGGNDTDGFASGFVSFEGTPGNVSGQILLPAAGGSVGDNIYTVTLTQAMPQFILLTNLPTFSLAALPGIVVTSVDITFDYLDVQLGASVSDAQRQTWQLTSIPTETTNFATGGTMNIGQWIRSALTKYGNGYALIDDLNINIHFRRTDVNTPGFSVLYTPLDESPDLIAVRWMRSKQLFRDVSYIDPEVDWFSWLFESVDSFLDLELAPKISFRSVLYSVLIIGILFAFFKMTG